MKSWAKPGLLYTVAEQDIFSRTVMVNVCSVSCLATTVRCEPNCAKLWVCAPNCAEIQIVPKSKLCWEPNCAQSWAKKLSEVWVRASIAISRSNSPSCCSCWLHCPELDQEPNHPPPPVEKSSVARAPAKQSWKNQIESIVWEQSQFLSDSQPLFTNLFLEFNF